MKLDGRTAVITGAGSGIGRSMALILAAEGAKVVIADIDPNRAQSVAREIAQAGGTASEFPVNVASSEQVARLIQFAVDSYGSLDILCNNAGIMDGFLTVHEVDPDTWDQILRVNLTGPYLGCHHAVPLMLQQGHGVILNTASVAGLRGGRAGAAYTASKFGVVGLTLNIAAAFGDLGIRCNAICPGAVSTNIVGNPISQLGDGLRSRNSATRPRHADPDELGRAALFLVSDDASYVNGSIVVVDGGYLAF